METLGNAAGNGHQRPVMPYEARRTAFTLYILNLISKDMIGIKRDRAALTARRSKGLAEKPISYLTNLHPRMTYLGIDSATISTGETTGKTTQATSNAAMLKSSAKQVALKDDQACA